jgi:hypothetical protein
MPCFAFTHTHGPTVSKQLTVATPSANRTSSIWMKHAAAVASETRLRMLRRTDKKLPFGVRERVIPVPPSPEESSFVVAVLVSEGGGAQPHSKALRASSISRAESRKMPRVLSTAFRVESSSPLILG